MPVVSYGLDEKVLEKLQSETKGLEAKEWKGKASEISDYVATWGLVRFWALSHSTQGRGGEKSDDGKSYLTWKIAREVLCFLVGKEFDLKPKIDAVSFKEKLKTLDFEKQVLLAELLIAIADSIQFWTMRLTEKEPK